MVKQYFTQDDAMAIMSIPLSSKLPKDGLVWAYMPRGNFMVRSAYKLAMTFGSDNDFGTTSKVQHHRQFQKKLWRLNIPNKVKSFALKVSINILLTKVNLCHRKVISEPTCEACGTQEESDGHVFWDRPTTCEIWNLSGIAFDAQGLVFREFVDFFGT